VFADLRKCNSFVLIRVDSAHMPVCCTSRTNDLLGDAFNLSPISCRIPQHISSACHHAVQKRIYALNLFAYLYRKLRTRHTPPNLRLFLQELYLAHIVPKTCFPATELAVSPAGNKERVMQRGNKLSSKPVLCDAHPTGNDLKQSSRTIMYLY
jgi:hypothetical protein